MNITGRDKTYDGRGNLESVDGKKLARGPISKKSDIKMRILNQIAKGLSESVNFQNFEKGNTIMIHRGPDKFEILVTAKKDPLKEVRTSDPADVTVKSIRSYVIDRVSRMPDMTPLGAEGNKVYARFPSGDFEMRIVKKRAVK